MSSLHSNALEVGAAEATEQRPAVEPDSPRIDHLPDGRAAERECLGSSVATSFRRATRFRPILLSRSIGPTLRRSDPMRGSVTPCLTSSLS